MDDIYQRETQNRMVLQNLDWRLQRLEDLNINMYDMMQKTIENQTLDGQDSPYRRSSWLNDDFHNRRRRRSSLSGYELSYDKEKSLPKSTTTISNRMPMTKLRLSTPDSGSLSKTSNQSHRRSTIQRLNSSASHDSNITRIPSNEYTSITDGFHILFFLLN